MDGNYSLMPRSGHWMKPAKERFDFWIHPEFGKIRGITVVEKARGMDFAGGQLPLWGL